MTTFFQMPSVKFDWMVQRPQQLMLQLAKAGNRVYYIEPKKEQYIKMVNSNLFLIGQDYPTDELYINGKVILWCSSPEQVVNIDKIPHDFIIYDVVDDASQEFSSWSKYIDNMLSKADIVFTSAENLYDKFKLKHQKVYLINNAVDTEIFDGSIHEKPKDLPLNKRIVGYVGAIASWMDWNLINEVVKDPHYNFVFVGPFYYFKPNLIRSNVYYLGLKEYKELPRYISNFDVCIIPFKINTMTNSCNPIKLYEYLAMGKPVVCTNLKEAYGFSQLCYIANDKEEFRENIKRAMNEKNETLMKERISYSRSNNWESRVSQIMSILQREFDL